METALTKRTQRLDNVNEKHQLNNSKTRLLKTLEKISYAKSIPRVKCKNPDVPNLNESIEMGLIDVTPKTYTLSSLGEKVVKYYGNKVKRIHQKSNLLNKLYILSISCILAFPVSILLAVVMLALIPLQFIDIVLGIFAIGLILCLIGALLLLVLDTYSRRLESKEFISLPQLISFFKYIKMSHKNIKCEAKIVKRYYQKNL